jgi:hypothetical protein
MVLGRSTPTHAWWCRSSAEFPVKQGRDVGGLPLPRGGACAGSQHRFQRRSSRPLPTCARSPIHSTAQCRPSPQTDATDDLVCDSIVHSSLRRLTPTTSTRHTQQEDDGLYGTPRPACVESEFSATSMRKVLDGYRNLCNATNKQCMSSDTSLSPHHHHPAISVVGSGVDASPQRVQHSAPHAP